ncbi:hypothetical protein M1512_00440 [Patescibacteria group bacterium]|nr:hypothetical protein [Patescibacteria group bacterium]
MRFSLKRLRLNAWQLLSLLIIPVLATISFGIYSSTKPINATIDLSWPNCSDIPNRFFKSAVIGVTGGLDFHSNPCAGNEMSVVSTYNIYSNTGDPGFPRIKQLGKKPLACHGLELVCYSFNYGYTAGRYARLQAQYAGLHASMWWLDVESINSWTNSIAANRADIEGMALGIIGSGHNLLTMAIGIYSAVNQWQAIVGNWRPGFPLWLGTGDLSLKAAKSACVTPSITGGPIVLTQYTVANLDYDYVCHNTSLRPLRLGFVKNGLLY